MVQNESHKGWCKTSTVDNIKFEDNNTIIAVEVSRDWEDIGEGWKRRAEYNPKVRYRVIE